MSKVKFTKSELKKQRDSLKQFRRYLPTLQLKKQQLQMKILETRRELARKMEIYNKQRESIQEWSGLLADVEIDIKPWVIPAHVELDSVNIAGANIPILKKVTFDEAEYDFYLAPLWIDQGIAELRILMRALVEADVIKRQIEKLERELRITTQRVNLFEKIKIPECLDNIRRIRINLGDQQANAVGISKVAKKKIEIADSEVLEEVFA